MSQTVRELPQGYERVEHHDTLTLHNEAKGIIVTIIERDGRNQDTDKWPYKASAAQNQKPLYEGVFPNLSHAEDKVYEVAHNH